MPTPPIIRVLLPAALLEKLAAQSGGKKADVEALIVRAVEADLRRETAGGAIPSRRRKERRRA